MDASIALFDASIGETPAQRNFERELDARVEPFKVSEGALPPVPGGDEAFPYDGVVISGSQTSVYEDRAWIADLETWVRRADDVGVPMFGICWGHQLLAQALGGSVVDMGRYELGYHRIERTVATPLFEDVDEAFVAFTTHSDEVVELPPGGTATAANDHALQGFKRGYVFGVQFHPEYDLETARLVTKQKDLAPERIQAVLDDITPERYEQARAATRVFDNFLAIIERRKAR
jgi:GMP synthase (glutamine-hydrolysing)